MTTEKEFYSCYILHDYITKSPPLNRPWSTWRLRWFALYDNKKHVKESKGKLIRQVLLRYFENENAFLKKSPPKGNYFFEKILSV